MLILAPMAHRSQRVFRSKIPVILSSDFPHEAGRSIVATIHAEGPHAGACHGAGPRVGS
jgi:hypothetical protein